MQQLLPPKILEDVCAYVTDFSIQPNRLVAGLGLLPRLSLELHSDTGVGGVLAARPL